MPNRLVLALSNILSRWTRNINRSKNQCQSLTGYGDDNVKMLTFFTMAFVPIFL